MDSGVNAYRPWEFFMWDNYTLSDVWHYSTYRIQSGFSEEASSLDSDGIYDRPDDMPGEVKIVSWGVSLNNVGEPQGKFHFLYAKLYSS